VIAQFEKILNICQSARLCESGPLGLASSASLSILDEVQKTGIQLRKRPYFS